MKYALFFTITAVIGLIAYQIVGGGLPAYQSTVDICELRKTPRKYTSWESVSVSGKVTSSYTLFGSTMYEIKQPGDSCAIKVLASGASPKEGQSLKVNGELKESFKLGDTRMLVILEE